MKRIVYIIQFFLIINLLFFQSAFAQDKIAERSAILEDRLPEFDCRILVLEEFLKDNQSPLAKYAEIFIKAADKYGLDWKLLPAITGVESSFGKRIPFGSYNAYGWGNGTYYFSSWEESINYISRSLKENYINHGLDSPQKIGPVYAPPSKNWATKVNHFMSQIDLYYHLSFTI